MLLVRRTISATRGNCGRSTCGAVLKINHSRARGVENAFVPTGPLSNEAKSDEWDERGRLRTEQLDGIEKALEILTSDEARKTFAASAVRPQDTFGTEGERGRLGSHRLEVRNRK